MIEETDGKRFYSDWVQENFLQVSKMLSVSFNGIEDRILNLLEEIEFWYQAAGREKKKEKKVKKRQVDGESPELKRLQ